jgi:hypothetical protein
MKCFDPMLTTAFAGDIGVAREDITPPVGIYARNWGAAAHDAAEGVHRPLTLTALALSDSTGIPLILISADLGWWTSREDEWGVRGALLGTLGLDPARVLISLSHTHAGPNLSRENRDKPGGALISPYLDTLRDVAIRATRAALDLRRPARLSWRYGRCDLATNRDLASSDGKRFLVGANPGEAADDALLVGRIEDAGNGKIVVVLVNYACHPTTLASENRLLSPDYVGAMREIIESAVGAPCLFLQGASGDLAPAEDKVGDPGVADRNGRRLGYAALAVLEGWPEACLTLDAVVESGAPLAVFRIRPAGLSKELRASLHTIDLPLKPLPTVAEIEEAWKQCTDRVIRERLWRQRGVRRIVGDGVTSPIPLWAWRIGEALLIAQPNEAYSRFQLELRSRFQPRPVAVLNVTNGYGGYLPPRAHYSRDQYSVSVSPFAEGCLEMATAAATALASELLEKPNGQH